MNTKNVSWVARGSVAVLAAWCAAQAFAQTAGQKTYKSAGQACQALLQAVQHDDEAALETIIGKDVIVRGNEAHKLERQQFAQKYDQMHRLVQEPEGITVLYVGAENWPFPIPLASKNGVWYFDSQAGKQEIMYRRIGEDELAAMEVMDRFAADKKQPGTKAAESDAVYKYADTLASSGSAANEGKAFHGYYFRAVASNPSAKENSLMLVAYPAEYRTSGVMTFIVTVSGAMFEKDLGANTPRLAKQMNQRSGTDWHPVQ
jgi:Protein of unknown function (DUF2950)